MLKTKISHTLPYDRPYFVLEMNNSINKIMGVGIISIIQVSKRERMYENYYYNRYTYQGKRYISIDDSLTVAQLQTIKDLFETPLFYGKGHMKRGQSMTHFPYKKMTKEHMTFLKSLFK